MVSCVLNHRARWRQANSGYNCELAGLITAGACAGCCRYKITHAQLQRKRPFPELYIVCHCVVLCCHTCPVACIPNERVGILLAHLASMSARCSCTQTSVSARCSCVQRACQYVARVFQKVVLAVNLLCCVHVRVLCLSGVGWGVMPLRAILMSIVTQLWDILCIIWAQCSHNDLCCLWTVDPWNGSNKLVWGKTRR